MYGLFFISLDKFSFMILAYTIDFSHIYDYNLTVLIFHGVSDFLYVSCLCFLKKISYVLLFGLGPLFSSSSSHRVYVCSFLGITQAFFSLISLKCFIMSFLVSVNSLRKNLTVLLNSVYVCGFI